MVTYGNGYNPYNPNAYGGQSPYFGGGGGVNASNPYFTQQGATGLIGSIPAGYGASPTYATGVSPENPGGTGSAPYWTPNMQATERLFTEKSSPSAIATYGILDQIRFQNYGLQAREEQLRFQQLGDLYGGFSTARSELDRFGGAAYQRAFDREEQQRGSANSRLIQSGLYNSSQAINVDRAVASDSERRLLDIDSQLAGLYANLETNRAQAMYQAQEGLAGFYDRTLRTNQALLLEEFFARTGRSGDFFQQPEAPDNSGAIWGALGTAIGGALGGPLGAGLGGALFGTAGQ